MDIPINAPTAATASSTPESPLFGTADGRNSGSTQFIELMQRALAATPRRDAPSEVPPPRPSVARDQLSSGGMRPAFHARPMIKRVRAQQARGAEDSCSAPESKGASKARASEAHRLSTDGVPDAEPVEGEEAQADPNKPTDVVPTLLNLTGLPVACGPVPQPKADLSVEGTSNQTSNGGKAVTAAVKADSTPEVPPAGPASNAQQSTVSATGSQSPTGPNASGSSDAPVADGRIPNETHAETNPASLATDTSGNPAIPASPNPDELTGAGMNVAVAPSAPTAVKAPSNKASVKLEPASGLTAFAPSEADGTAAAQGVAVTKTEQQDEFAAPEKEVPHDDRVAVDNGPGVSHSTRSAGDEPLFKGDAGHVAAVTSTGSTVNEAALVSVTADPRISAVERTHDLVALHALRLHDANAESLRIVLKPGGGLELSLELRKHEGVIEARAAMQSGDFAHLNRHWSDLQQRLETRGVRLAPLTCTDQFMNSNMNGSNQQPNRAFKEDAAAGENFPAFNFASTPVTTTAPQTARATARGWESWA